MALDEAEPGAARPTAGVSLDGLASSISALVAGELANKVLRFAAAAVLARGLTAAEFGLLNVGIAVAGILVIVTTLGLPELGGRMVAVDAGSATRLGGLVVTVRVLATLALGLAGLAVLSVAWPQRLGFGVAILAMALAMSATADWLGRALERMRRVGAGAAAGGLAALVGAVVVTVASGSVVAGLCAFVAGELVADAVYWSAARGRGRARPQLAGAAVLLRQSWPLALSAIAIYSYYANLDTIIIAATRSEAEAGVYSAAYRVYLAACTVGIFAAYAAFPRLSRMSGIGTTEGLVASLRPTLEWLLAYGVAVVGVALLVGEPLLELLFGARFGAAGDTFILLCVSTAWYCLGYPVGYNLIAAGRNRRFLAGASVGAVVNLGLGLVLIGELGMIGAGAATSASIILATVAWLGTGLAAPPARPVYAAVAASSVIALIGLLWTDGQAWLGGGLLAAGLLGGLSKVRRA